MFCSNSGSEIKSGEKFCMVCGKAIDTDRKIVSSAPAHAKPVHESSITQQNRMRSETALEMTRMIDYFNRKQPQYDEYDYCNDRIDYLAGKSVKEAIIPGSIFIGVGVAIGIASFCASFIDLLIVALIGSFSGIGIIIIVIGILLAVSRKKRLTSALIRQSELASELTDYYRAYGPCLVGAEYSNPKILALLADLLRQGRADTIKEAINVLLDDAHKTRMEIQAELTAQSARQAASGATAAAVFTAARLFL